MTQSRLTCIWSCWVLASLFVLGTLLENNTPHVGEYKVFEIQVWQSPSISPGSHPSGKPMTSALGVHSPLNHRLKLQRMSICNFSLRHMCHGILLTPLAGSNQGTVSFCFKRLNTTINILVVHSNTRRREGGSWLGEARAPNTFKSRRHPLNTGH